ncbi:MAG: PepSY domain-containing protein [Geminocystis sp.]|nr:PepSY domain-containing protein [Geminocystis sp.]HIK38426.1 PepSY domain-containing protein [Geminocystis sp. M7585_C2015_104]
MFKQTIRITLFFILATLFFPNLAVKASSDDDDYHTYRRRGNTKAAVEILHLLESRGYSPIVEMEYEDGLWEIKAYRDGIRREVKVDLIFGRIISEKRDDN